MITLQREMGRRHRGPSHSLLIAGIPSDVRLFASALRGNGETLFSSHSLLIAGIPSDEDGNSITSAEAAKLIDDAEMSHSLLIAGIPSDGDVMEKIYFNQFNIIQVSFPLNSRNTLRRKWSAEENKKKSDPSVSHSLLIAGIPSDGTTASSASQRSSRPRKCLIPS